MKKETIMKKTKTQTTSNVSVNISGSGCRVTAYLINKKILKELRSATEDDALYESNPYSLVGNIALDSIRVAQGFCIYTADDLKFEITVDDKSIEVEKVGLLDEWCEFEEEFTSERGKTLLARSENNESLGKGFIPKKNEMFIIEIEEFKWAESNCSFSAINALDLGGLEKLEIGLVDLDVETDLSNATYLAGLLNGMEKDIRYIRYQDKKYEFDLSIMNGSVSCFYLVEKKDDGKWKKEYLG